MSNNTAQQTKALYEIKFEGSDFIISTNSLVEFLHIFSEMKNEILESFSGNHDLFYSNLHRFKSMGPCNCSFVNKVDDLNFTIEVFNVRGDNKVTSIEVSLKDNPFKNVLSLSDFLSAFFTIYFSSFSVNETMLETFTMYANLTFNDDVLKIEKDSDVNLIQLQHFAGNYALEVSYTLHLGSGAHVEKPQVFFVQHKDKKEREDFLNYLISRKSTHNVTIRPIKNVLLHAFQNKK